MRGVREGVEKAKVMDTRWDTLVSGTGGVTSADQGFTLTETLMALLVVSLALTSIVVATNLVTRQNRKAATALAVVKSADGILRQMEGALSPFGPFTDNLSGDVHKLSYECRQPVRCNFALPPGRWTLRYLSAGRTLTSWPGLADKTGTKPRLEALVLQDGNGDTAGIVRLEAEQATVCQFDMISRSCREESRSSMQ